MLIREIVKELIKKQKLEETVYAQKQGDTEFLYSNSNISGINADDIVVNSANNTPGHQDISFASNLKVSIPIRKVTRVVDIKDDILTIKPHAENITEIEKIVRIYAPYKNESASYGSKIDLLKAQQDNNTASIYNITKILKEPNAQIPGVTEKQDANKSTFYVKESDGFVDQVAQTTYDLTSHILGQLQANKLVFAESSGRLNSALRSKFSDIAISPNKAVVKISKESQGQQQYNSQTDFKPKYYESKKISFMATFDHDYFNKRTEPAINTLIRSFEKSIPKGLSKKDAFRDFGGYLDTAASLFGQETVEKYRESKPGERQLKLKDFSKQIKVPTGEILRDPSKSITGDNLVSGGLKTAYYRPFTLTKKYISTSALNGLINGYQKGSQYNSNNPLFAGLKPILIQGLDVNPSRMEFFNNSWIPSFLKKLYLEIERGSISLNNATAFKKDFESLLNICVNKGIIDTHESDPSFNFDVMPISLLPRVDAITAGLVTVGFKDHLRKSLRDLFYVAETPQDESSSEEMSAFDKKFEEAYLKAQAAAFNYRIKNMDYKSSLFSDPEFRKLFLDIFEGILITDFHKKSADRGLLSVPNPDSPGELMADPALVAQIFKSSTHVELESSSAELLKQFKKALTEKGDAASDQEIQSFLTGLGMRLPRSYNTYPAVLLSSLRGKESIYYKILKANKKNIEQIYQNNIDNRALTNDRNHFETQAFVQQFTYINYIVNWVDNKISDAINQSSGSKFEDIVKKFDNLYSSFFNQVMIDISSNRFSSLDNAYGIALTATAEIDESADLSSSIRLAIGGSPVDYVYQTRQKAYKKLTTRIPRIDPMTLSTSSSDNVASLICDLLKIDKKDSIKDICKEIVVKDIESNIDLMESEESGDSIEPIVIFDDSVNTGSSLKNIIRYIFASLANSNVDTSYLADEKISLPVACITSFLYK